MKRVSLILENDVKVGKYVPIKVPATPLQLGRRKNTAEEIIVARNGKILFPEKEYKIRDNLLYLEDAARKNDKFDIIII
jgi:hypothetical protein